MASSSSCTIINYLENFLLNSGPKQDCLVHIFKYINVYDMVNLSESSKHSELFMEFFKDRVVDLDSFDFTKLPSNPGKAELFQKVFVHFGSDMQKIKVAVSSVTVKIVMENIIEHCVAGNLTELEIDIGVEIDSKHVLDYGWPVEAQPISNRLEKLSLIRDNYTLSSYRVLNNLYQRDMTNLKSLKLQEFNFSEGWTSVFRNELSNITELYLNEVKLHESVHEFELFLNQFTNLQVFVHLRENNKHLQPEVIADCLYRRFPQLRGIGCNVDDNRHNSTFAMGNRFNFLQNFTNLAEIYVACYVSPIPSDIHSILQFVPNIKMLSLVELKLFRQPAAVCLITRSIKEIINRRRDRFPGNDRVKIIVDDTQYRDFMVQKNVDKIIRLLVKMKTIQESKKKRMNLRSSVPT